jgi:F420H(2)-dependent quinone reductase
MDVLFLTTIGRRTGNAARCRSRGSPRARTPWLIVASAAGSARNPAWYHNLASHPDHVWIELPQRTLRVMPEQLEGARREARRGVVERACVTPAMAFVEPPSSRVDWWAATDASGVCGGCRQARESRSCSRRARKSVQRWLASMVELAPSVVDSPSVTSTPLVVDPRMSRPSRKNQDVTGVAKAALRRHGCGRPRPSGRWEWGEGGRDPGAGAGYLCVTDSVPRAAG